MVIVLYLFGIFMGAIDTGIVTPARTIIQNGLGVDEKTGIWMITIYTLAYAASIPVMGKLADKYGRKYVYLTSIFLFGLGSLFCGLSQDFGSFGLLMAARAVQAIGGGGIMPVATAEFGTSFPVQKRGMALGLVGGVYGIANIFGSSAGSAILDIFGKDNWQYIFYVNIPISLFVVIAGIIFLPNTVANDVKKIDKLGILLVVTMVLSLLYGLRNIDFFDFINTLQSVKVYPYLIVFIVLLPLFILAERKAEDPVVNLHYFTESRIVITLIVGFISGVVLMGMIFVPQFAENSLKVPTGNGGYFVIILGVFTGISAPLSGRLVDKFSAKKVLMMGFAIVLAGSLFLVFVATEHQGMLEVIASLLLIGLGLGFTMGAPLNYMMLENTKKEESNSALATLSLIRSIGTTIAPAIMVGFLAHAGGAVQDNITGVLPSEVDAPKLPYVQELTEKLNKLKADPNMKDKLLEVEIPDLSSKIKFDMKGNGDYKMPDDLAELMKTSDVTNITDRVKILASKMFAEISPDLISKISSGVQKGIDGMQSGLPEMEKNVGDLQKGYDGLGEAIKGMKDGAAGLEQAIGRMNGAILQQKAALTQMNKLYEQMNAMTKARGAATTGMPGAGAGHPGMPGAGAATTGMPGAGAATTGMPGAGAAQPGMPGAGAVQPGMPGAGAAQPGMPGSSTSDASPDISIVDMIPAQVKANIPASVLEQLKNVKSLADLKIKIGELSKAITELGSKVKDLQKQRENLLANIKETEGKQQQMLAAIEAIKSAQSDIKDTVGKMTLLKEAVPQAFDESGKNYLKEIDSLSPKIESVFQRTLNIGFKQVYLTAAIASIIALLTLVFYRRRKAMEL